jgi:hypothetical protein
MAEESMHLTQGQIAFLLVMAYHRGFSEGAMYKFELDSGVKISWPKKEKGRKRK